MHYIFNNALYFSIMPYKEPMSDGQYFLRAILIAILVGIIIYILFIK
jgi:hypothetical protein